jgi:hypothetical protein
MVGLGTEKKTYSSRVFFQNPKNRITPAKNPNKNPNSIILKRPTLDFPRKELCGCALDASDGAAFPPAVSDVISLISSRCKA